MKNHFSRLAHRVGLRGPVLLWTALLGAVLLAGTGRPLGAEAVAPSMSRRGPALAEPATQPAPRLYHHAMVYDASLRVALLYSGRGWSPPWWSTWAFTSTAWQTITTTHVPHLDVGFAMAYDADRGLVLAGGLENNYSSHLWAYDGRDWKRLDFFPGAIDSKMVYDQARERLVTFGGYLCVSGYCGVSDRTWEYAHGQWMEADPIAFPPARAGHAMAYDAVRGVTVLFGGHDRVKGIYFQDTWEYNGEEWRRRITPQSPPARAGGEMAYDRARGVLTLFGGSGQDGLPLNDTWEYDGARWRQVRTPLAPSPRTLFAMAYDEARRLVILHGGVSQEPGHYFGDTWEYDGSTWRLVAVSRFFFPLSRQGRGVGSAGYVPLR